MCLKSLPSPRHGSSPAWAFRVHATSSSKTGGSSPSRHSSSPPLVLPAVRCAVATASWCVAPSQAFQDMGAWEKFRCLVKLWGVSAKGATNAPLGVGRLARDRDDVNGVSFSCAGSRGEVEMMNVCLDLQTRWTLLKKREERIQTRPSPEVPTLKCFPALSPFPSLLFPRRTRLHTHHHIHPSARHPSSSPSAMLVPELPLSPPSLRVHLRTYPLLTPSPSQPLHPITPPGASPLAPLVARTTLDRGSYTTARG